MSLGASGLLLALLFSFCAWLVLAEEVVLGLARPELWTLGAASPPVFARLQQLRRRPAVLRCAFGLLGALAQTGLAWLCLVWGRSVWPAGGVGPGLGLLLAALGAVYWMRELALRFSGATALRFLRYSAEPLEALLRVFAPFAAGLQQVVEAALRRVGAEGPRRLTEEEFLTGVEAGGEQGVLKPEIRDMMEGILGLETSKASEVMTPRVDLVGVAADAPHGEWLEVARRVRFRHLPVYRDSMDTIEGMLDLVRFLLDPEHMPAAAVEPPLFVAETASLHDLLLEFQRKRARCAIVLDEYGGTAGLITRGDILEEITADVEGEYAPESPPVQRLGDGIWLVDGRTSLEDLQDALALPLVTGQADRIAGWAMEQAGRLLRVGESVEAQGCRVTVRRMRKHRILQLRLERLADATVAGDRAREEETA